MNKRLFVLICLILFTTISTGGPCTSAYATCIQEGGTVDQCWAGLEACLATP